MTGACVVVVVGAVDVAATVSLTGGGIVVVVSTGFGAGDGTGAATFCTGAADDDRLRTRRNPPMLATATTTAAAAMSPTGDFFLRAAARSPHAGIITPGGVEGVGNGVEAAFRPPAAPPSGAAATLGSGSGARTIGVAEFRRCI